MNKISKEELFNKLLQDGYGLHFKEDYNHTYSMMLKAMDEYAEQEAIAFLDSIREYVRESHCDIAQDERTSKEFYSLYKSQP